MARYFVLLRGSTDGPPFVVAEVVREHDDDGRYREISLAAALAGTNAMIFTPEELEESAFGRAALRRWQAGNDSFFDLDTISHQLGTLRGGGVPFSGQPLSPEQRDELGCRLGERSEAVRASAEEVRGNARRLVGILQANLERLRENRRISRSLLDGLGRGKRDAPRANRHLRSVS